MAQIAVSRVSKSFGDKLVLDDVSLEVERGEFLTLVGPSGCGKSTLLRIIAGLEPQTCGEVHIDGRCVDAVRPADRNLAMVFQSYALYPHLSVAENIGLPLAMREHRPLHRLPCVGRFLPGAAAARTRIAEAVSRVASPLGLGELLDRKPGQLSGGQRQRVALARAMVRQPAAFLMDEPLSNLDANMRAQMQLEIADLHRRLETTFVYVTHDQAEAMTMSTRVVVLMDGHIQQVGPPQEIYQEPASLRVAQFFGGPSINLFPAVARKDGAAEADDLVLPLGGSRLAAGQALTVAVRPENLQLGVCGPDGFTGLVTRVEYLGVDAVVHVRLLKSGRSVIARAPAHTALQPGEEVGLRPSALMLFDAAGGRVRAERAPARLAPRRVET